MLIYGTFFNSVLSTYVASQPTLVANKETSKSLFTTVANPIPRKCLTFASRCLKVVWHNGLNVHIETSGVISVCCRKFLGVLDVVTSNICISNMIFPLMFIKVWKKLMQINKGCYWIKIEESREYNFFDSIENLSIRSFWYHCKWHQGNSWVLLRSHSSIKRNSCVMLYPHALNNEPQGYLNNTVYVKSYRAGSRLHPLMQVLKSHLQW